MLLVCPSCASSYNIPDEKLGQGRTVRCTRCQACWYASPPPPADDFDAAVAPILAAADETAGSELARLAAAAPAAAASPDAPADAPFAAAGEQDAAVRPMADASDEFMAARDLNDPAAIDGEVLAVSARPADRAIEEPLSGPARKEPAAGRLSALVGGALALAAWRPQRFAKKPPLLSPVLQATAPSPRFRPAPRRGAVAAAAPYAAFALSCLFVMGLAARGPIMAASPAAATLYAALGLADESAPVTIVSVRSEIGSVDGGDVLLVEGELASRARQAVNVPAIRVVVRDAQGVELYAWPAQSLKLTLEPGERTVFRARLAAPPPTGRTVQVRFETGSAEG